MFTVDGTEVPSLVHQVAIATKVNVTIWCFLEYRQQSLFYLDDIYEQDSAVNGDLLFKIQYTKVTLINYN